MDEKLQERLAYLERQADELSDEVARQAKLVDRLARQVGLLIEREATREAEGTGGVVIGDERPPPY